MKLMTIDGNSLVNRAFYGIRTLNAPDGTPTNAVYGFIRILQKLLADEKPDALIVAFDRREPTFRHELDTSYKATRTGMPDELAVQMPVVREVLDAMKIKSLDCAGWEADDIIGTAVKNACQNGWDSVVVTGDRDSLQLVGDCSRVLLVRTRSGQTETTDYTTEKFIGEYGFEPLRLIDLKALMGDSSDNIPGVKGVGEKTALDLVRRFGGIEEIYANLDTLDIRDSMREKLRAGKEDAARSKLLATIRLDVPIEASPDGAMIGEPDTQALFELFSKLGFSKLIESMKLAGGQKEVADTPTVAVPQGVDVTKIGSNIKDLIRAGGRRDWSFDVSLAAYVLSPTDRKYDIDSLSWRYLGTAPSDDEQSTLAQLYVVLTEKLREGGMEKLFYDVELPLCEVLADMETAGVMIDAKALHEYGKMLGERIDKTEGNIYELSGETFNIASPKQLGVILFDRLGLPAPKKTKTGYSTAAEVLDKLEDKHAIIKEIKEYRELTKLKATYADGLAKVIAPDGRIHTSFQMMATATGRLSSTEPNLQNIPVRRELGSALRSMFIASPEHVLVDADYSQIELRLLAHIANDEAMINAFLSGEDIHTVTAAQVFGVATDDVTPLMRSRAKAVNFGIVYGISAFSLSQDIEVTVGEAKVYIDSYFERFSGVRKYMAEIVERAKTDGYVTTLFGRRRYIPELISRDHNVRAFGERVALNMPIQGTAADIMKIAMVNVDKALKNESPQSKLVLQIHDELIIEAPEGEEEVVARLLKREMEGAAQLLVPLTVDAHWGKSWNEAK